MRTAVLSQSTLATYFGFTAGIDRKSRYRIVPVPAAARLPLRSPPNPFLLRFIVHYPCCVPTKLLPQSVVGYSIGMVSGACQCKPRTVNLALVQIRYSKMTHDIIPDEYFSSGGPSSVGMISKAASIPAIFAHMLLRAKKRPGHSRAPNPNAWFGNAGKSGENQRSG